MSIYFHPIAPNPSEARAGKPLQQREMGGSHPAHGGTVYHGSNENLVRYEESLKNVESALTEMAPDGKPYIPLLDIAKPFDVEEPFSDGNKVGVSLWAPIENNHLGILTPNHPRLSPDKLAVRVGSSTNKLSNLFGESSKIGKMCEEQGVSFDTFLSIILLNGQHLPPELIRRDFGWALSLYAGLTPDSNDPKVKDLLQACLHPSVEQDVLATMQSIGSEGATLKIYELARKGIQGGIDRRPVLVDEHGAIRLPRLHQGA